MSVNIFYNKFFKGKKSNFPYLNFSHKVYLILIQKVDKKFGIARLK